MSVTVKVNGTSNTLVHKGSSGVSTATIPDVCKTPSPAGPVPVPYPNISMSSDLDKGTTTVKADGGNMIAVKGSEFSRSTGDEPGTAGGVKSSVNMKESTWILYSFDVKMDGKNACRLSDKMFHNKENTVNLAGEIQAALGLSDAEFKEVCKKCKKKAKEEIDHMNRSQKAYQEALNSNPKDAAQVEAKVSSWFAERYFARKEAGHVSPTDKGGPVVKKQKGACGPLKEMAVKAHEDVHQQTKVSLQAQHGAGTPAFNAAWSDGKAHAQDEINAHEAQKKVNQKFVDECGG